MIQDEIHLLVGCGWFLCLSGLDDAAWLLSVLCGCAGSSGDTEQALTVYAIDTRLFIVTRPFIVRDRSVVLGRVLNLIVESTDPLVQELQSLCGLLLLFLELFECPCLSPVLEETRKLLKVLTVVMKECAQIKVLPPRSRSGSDVDITLCVFDGFLCGKL